LHFSTAHDLSPLAQQSGATDDSISIFAHSEPINPIDPSNRTLIIRSTTDYHCVLRCYIVARRPSIENPQSWVSKPDDPSPPPPDCRGAPGSF